jgi:hypothetical protein
MANRPTKPPIRRVDWRIDPWGNSLPARTVAGAIFGTPSDKAAPASQPVMRAHVGNVGAASAVYPHLPSRAVPSSPTIRRDLPAAKSKRWS